MNMKEEKYYTPEIEEFHVGFEFEFYNGEQWCKCTYNGFELVNYEGLIEFYPEDYRVKYLDKEDIESLGWKHSLIQNYKYTDSFFKDSNPKYAQWSLELNDTMSMQKDGRYVSDEDEINSVCIKFFHPDDSSGQTIFYGTIKNKSELKKVLKMLGI